jgi:transcriptional regulator
MYRPAYSKADDFQLSLDLVKDFPLGLLISQSPSLSDLPEANYYPFFLHDEGGLKYLVGHIAKANPHWRSLDQKTVGIHFLGPNSYISPSWYTDPLNVPTWNYAAVYITGTVQLVEEANQIEDILQKSVNHFEALNQSYWNYDLPEAFRSKLISAIVGIRIKIKSIEGKFKMSQNRKPEDYQGVIDHFESAASDSARSMARWMKRCQFDT